MPNNLRPRKIIDPLRDGYTLAQIEAEQNIWDLLDAQEKANKLKIEELNLNKKYIEELSKQNNKKEIENQNNLILDYLNQLEKFHNESCNTLGLNYNDIYDFTNLISTNEDKKTIYKQEIEIYKKLIEELKNNKDFNSDLTIYYKYINQADNQIKKYKKSLITRLINHKKIKELNQNIIDWNNDIINIKNTQSKFEKEHKKHHNEYIKQYENNIKKLEKLYYNQNKYDLLKQEFNDFRKNHYNLEVETLFRQLKLDINPIKPSEAINQGTIEDYKTFINKKLLEVV